MEPPIFQLRELEMQHCDHQLKLAASAAPSKTRRRRRDPQGAGVVVSDLGPLWMFSWPAGRQECDTILLKLLSLKMIEVVSLKLSLEPY